MVFIFSILYTPEGISDQPICPCSYYFCLYLLAVYSNTTVSWFCFPKYKKLLTASLVIRTMIKQLLNVKKAVQTPNTALC